MQPLRRSIGNNGNTFFAIFLCFFFSSGIYLSWMYHLSDYVPDHAVDFHSMVTAYLSQALGLGIFALADKKRPSLLCFPLYTGCLVLLLLCSVPAVRSAYLVAILLFGLLSNVLIGVLAGFYLRDLASFADESRCGLVFGGAYAAATVGMWLVSMIGGTPLLKTGYAFLIYLPAAALSLLFQRRLESGKEPSPAEETPVLPEKTRPLLLLAAGTVFLLSLVKSIGFDFPAVDLAQGVSLETSRILYAVGLLAAGLISDKSRKYGAICTLAALITPFIMLALRGEPISATVFWALDYLFFGFFSVYRVLCFSDLKRKLSAPWLAGLGLIAGRIGDAAGAGIDLGFSGRVPVLVLIAALLFFLTVFLFFRLYQKLYLSDPAKERNDLEVFERFSRQYALSPKERAVLRLVIEERSNAEIAQALYVSESTVKFHIHNILKKADCRNRTSLLSRYHEASERDTTP